MGWTCGKKGHRSTACPTTTVRFAEAAEAQIFLTLIVGFNPADQDNNVEPAPIEDTFSIPLASKSNVTGSVNMQDTMLDRGLTMKDYVDEKVDRSLTT